MNVLRLHTRWKRVAAINRTLYSCYGDEVSCITATCAVLNSPVLIDSRIISKVIARRSHIGTAVPSEYRILDCSILTVNGRSVRTGTGKYRVDVLVSVSVVGDLNELIRSGVLVVDQVVI